MDEKIDNLISQIYSIEHDNESYVQAYPLDNKTNACLRECVWDWLIENKLIEMIKPSERQNL